MEAAPSHQAHGCERQHCQGEGMAAQDVVAALHVFQGDGGAMAVVYREGSQVARREADAGGVGGRGSGGWQAAAPKAVPSRLPPLAS